MPFYLKEKDIIPELAGFNSVLIVPCRFCPAASLAVSRNEPYIELLRRFLKTDSYEKFIERVRSNLADRDVKTAVFRSNLLHQFVLCSWSAQKRAGLRETAEKYEALLILGCEAAVRTVRDAVQSTSCRIFQGMDTVGLMSIKPRFHLPCSISLELDSVSPMHGKNSAISPSFENVCE